MLYKLNLYYVYTAQRTSSKGLFELYNQNSNTKPEEFWEENVLVSISILFSNASNVYKGSMPLLYDTNQYVPLRKPKNTRLKKTNTYK